MKKLTAVLLAVLMSVLALAGCSKKEEVTLEEYTGVLSRVRLGMPINKVFALMDSSEAYFESDTEIWYVNNDTDLMEIKSMIPEDSQFFYTDDSLITFNFRTEGTANDRYLESYLEELPCKVSRETAMSYYEAKKESLVAKFSPDPTAVSTTMTGSEGVDMNLDYSTVMTLSSFEVTFNMELTYDTVDGIEDYYGTFFSIEVKELKNKTAIDLNSEEKKK